MFHIKLAGHTFTIENHYEYLKNLCKDYLTDCPGELITLSKEVILSEQTDGGHWPLDYLESLAAYRKICERLLEKDILLFHCSALAYHNNGYLFTAPSGTGKSTHSRLWREHLGDAIQMINDDKPLLEINGDNVIVYGTPFAGKEGLQTNMSAPVKGIVVLHQAKENHITRLTSQEAYPLLLSQTYRSKRPERTLKTLQLVEQLAKLPVYSLGCTISHEAVKLAFQSLIQE